MLQLSGNLLVAELGQSKAVHVRTKFVLISAAVVAAVFGCFLMVVYAVPQLKSFGVSEHALYPSPSKSVTLGTYVDEAASYEFVSVASAQRFEARIDSFSAELKLQTLNNETIVAPRSWQVTYRKIEGRPIAWGFRVIAPHKPGDYEIMLRFIVSNWIFSREYQQRVTVKVEPVPNKPLPEKLLSITLDKRIYSQGDLMRITIKNLSNQTMSFGNAAYDVCFERYTGTYWEFYDSVLAAQVIMYLRPGETGSVTWKLGDHADRPYLPGQYRVFVHGVYAEFEVA